MRSHGVDLSNAQGLIIFIAIVVVLSLFSCVVPAIRRKEDKLGEGELFTTRGIAVCGAGLLYYSEIFCRFTFYKNSVVWCYMSAHTFKYKDIVFEKMYARGDLCLRILVKGVPVKLIGAAKSLERVSDIIGTKTGNFQEA